jgi:hypothetical protein
MKKISYALFPLLFAGFILPDDQCRQKTANQPLPANAGQYDGPYVLYKNDKVYVKYIISDSAGVKSVKQDSMAIAERASISLAVMTDEPGKTFSVSLKSQLENEKSEFSKVSKQFIVSDIEGNFRAFRKILQAGKVIDENFNWTFGEGHLVLTGDFVDRGIQQTEVLWLIYSLEEKAKAAGGYVHYVLGNHEIMNMNGDLRYLSPKYQESASLLNERFIALYGENSEIGRWLRTKNVIEKVGEILFCHAGISADVNRLDLSTSRINKLVRPFYPDTTYQYNSLQTEILYSDLGPFWYRGYYHGANRASSMQVDSTLAAYKVKRIATGHTVIADTISVLYNGRLLNTDVHHAKGLSEAILVEDGNYYRITPVGEKFLVINGQ